MLVIYVNIFLVLVASASSSLLPSTTSAGCERRLPANFQKLPFHHSVLKDGRWLPGSPAQPSSLQRSHSLRNYSAIQFRAIGSPRCGLRARTHARTQPPHQTFHRRGKPNGALRFSTLIMEDPTWHRCDRYVNNTGRMCHCSSFYMPKQSSQWPLKAS